MYISIVILTCNQKELTLRCLHSLSRFIADDDCEIVLVDNGSTDGTSEAVRNQFPKVRQLIFHTNKGVAAGRNAGLRLCTGEYLMILDNDTIADRDTIFGLAEFLRKHPDVGVVAPKLLSPDGQVQKSFKRFPGLPVKIHNVLLSKNKTSVTRKVPTRELEPFYLIGAAQMFPRDVYLMAGPFDENIFFGPEDADFCMSVRSVWKRVVYYPALSIIHDWQRSTTKKIFSAAGRRHAKALLYFYAKHKRFI